MVGTRSKLACNGIERCWDVGKERKGKRTNVGVNDRRCERCVHGNVREERSRENSREMREVYVCSCARENERK